jgi:hypothetical protein
MGLGAMLDALVRDVGAAQDIAVLERVPAEEIARPTPDTAIVEEAGRALDQLRTRIGNAES